MDKYKKVARRRVTNDLLLVADRGSVYPPKDLVKQKICKKGFINIGDHFINICNQLQEKHFLTCNCGVDKIKDI